MKFSTTFLLVILLFLTSAASAKMAAPLDTETAKVIEVLKAKGKKISAEEQQTLKLAQFAHDALGMKSIQHFNAREPAKMDASTMKTSLERAIMNRDWDTPIKAEHKAYLTGHSAELVELFGEESYAWAWTRAQLGEQDLAKVILMKRFKSEHERVMKMTSAFRGYTQPLSEAEAIEKALMKKATPVQKTDIENRMREMKSHLSNLPDSGIVT